MSLNLHPSQLQAYAFGSDTMGWINGDHFMGQGLPMKKVDITTPSIHDELNTAVRIALRAQNSVVGVHYNDVDHFQRIMHCCRSGSRRSWWHFRF